MSDWMIYGANGYSGRLIAEKAFRAGKKPILAGRTREAIRPLAEKYDLPYRVFDLASPAEVTQGIRGVKLVLNCAGPFSKTHRWMVDTCLAQHSHYLDITGEIDVFEAIHQRHEQAVEAQSVCIPGVGFDVVPSDCLAASLAARLPDASELELAFMSTGGFSPGTMKTMIENLPQGSKIRRNGRIISTPTGSISKEVQFSSRKIWTTAIPWGDVSTAYYSTGIPNITVYTAFSRKVGSILKWTRPFASTLGARPVQSLLKKTVERFVHGPSEEVRKKARTFLWGQVKNSAGKTVSATLDVPEGYAFTATAALACVERVLQGEVGPGVWTPSKAFGASFVCQLPETNDSRINFRIDD